FHSPYSFPGTPNLNLTSSNKMAEALKTLTNSIDKLMTQLQDQRRPPSRSRSRNFTPSTIINDPQETLQALLALMNNNPDIFNNARNQTSYLGIPKDESLFLLAEMPIRPKSIVNMPILRKKSTRTKITDLIDLEEGESTKDPDVEMEEVHEDHE
ncbi:32457_t:CDS:2, partial [Racocetra persica]